MARGWKIGIGAAAGLGLLLAALEWRRRGLPQTPGMAMQGSATKAKKPEHHFDRPEEFAVLCAKLETTYAAMNERFRALMHTRTEKSEELDDAGKTIGGQIEVSDVDFHEEKERYQSKSRTDLEGKPLGEPGMLEKMLQSQRTPLIYPFSLAPDAKKTDYSYSFAGMEMLDDEGPLAKVAYEPNPPLDRKLAGFIWVDPDSGEPRRFFGKQAKPAFPIDRREMMVYYATADNGQPQIQRVESLGSGGFAILRKNLRVNVAFTDYRPKTK